MRNLKCKISYYQTSIYEHGHPDKDYYLQPRN